MSAKRRVHSQTTATEPDDRFLAGAMEFIAWSRGNSQQLIVGVLAVAIVIAGLSYYLGFRGDMEVQGANELNQIQLTLTLGDPASAAGRLNQFIERYAGSSSELEARLILGQLYLGESQGAEAVAVLAPMARDLDNPLGIQGALLLATAYEDIGSPAEAEGLYIRVANRAELEFQVRDALEAAARIRTSLGNFAGAELLLQEILDGMEASDPGRAVIEMRLSELRHLQRTI